MAEITEKLYPPIIKETSPAFYKENGVAKIIIPFSMNKGVNTNNIKGFSLKIRTVFSNKLISLLTNTEDVLTSFANNEVSFDLKDTSDMVVGQYFKIQLAYISQGGIVGYYSTVSTIKYTSKPKVYIYNLDEENETSAFYSKYFGVYEPSEDISEKPYSYKFSLYDEDGNIVETSDWLIHNSNTPLEKGLINNLTENASVDTYSFNSGIHIKQKYSLIYSVRTINNLEVSSPIYFFNEPELITDPLRVKLNATNIFEEGYINLCFLQDTFDNETFLDIEELQKEYPNSEITYNDTTQEYTILTSDNETIHLTKLLITNPIYIAIFKSSSLDNFISQKLIHTIYCNNYDYLVNVWNFKDLDIKQGMTYKYYFRLMTKNNNYSQSFESNVVLADFEDMFLWDGKKQVKIRFNPQVSSFKTNYLEQKIETLGSHYPFICRNGSVKYKEFPISGLISYKMDHNELFINAQQDLNISFDNDISRSNTPEDVALLESKNVETFNLVNYNISAEREFKLKLLEWLGNGTIKMFKSPVEGNYLVRLLNVSLSPEKTVGRMLHNFQCTAYEVEENSYNNLIKLGFITPESDNIIYPNIKIIKVADIIQNFNNETTIPINTIITLNKEHQIFESLKIETDIDNFYIHLGDEQSDSSMEVIDQNGFSLSQKDTFLPNLNLYVKDYYNYDELTAINKQDLIEKVGNTTISYQHLDGIIPYADKIIQEKEADVILGDFIKDFSEGGKSTILNFYVLNFKRKENKIIYQDDDGQYYFDIDKQQKVSFNRLCFYTVKKLSDNEHPIIHYLYINNNENLCSIIVDQTSVINFSETANDLVLVTNLKDNLLSHEIQEIIDWQEKDFYTIELTGLKDLNEETVTYDLTPPPGAVENENYIFSPNVNNFTISKIKLGPALYLQYACQKITIKPY